MNDTACSPARTGRVKWGRIICLAGALGLCVSFFLPNFLFAMTHSPDVVIDSPLEFIGYELNSGHHFWSDTVLDFILPFIAAAVLAPLLACRCVPRVDTARGTGKFLAWAQCVICPILLLAGLAWMGYVLADIWLVMAGPRIRLCFGPAVGLVGLVVAAVAMVQARLPRKAATALFVLSLYCSMIFAYYPLYAYEGIYDGLWLSLAGCVALILGSAIDWFQCRPVKETLR